MNPSLFTYILSQNMKVDGNVVFITGGASGIGFGLARRFAAAGSKVIVCGRRQEMLEEAMKLCPSISAFQGDVSTAEGRAAIYAKVLKDFPEVNVVINNAGVQNRAPRLTEPQEWTKHQQELDINLHAPMHLSMLFIPHLISRPDPVIINVSSGLSFVPIAAMPTYCATKAALHSFTLSLRQQLSSTPIKVIEVAPPAVNTDLGGKGLHDFGVPLEQYCDFSFAKLIEGDEEFGYGFSEKARVASFQERQEIFKQINGQHGPPVKLPGQ